MSLFDKQAYAAPALNMVLVSRHFVQCSPYFAAFLNMPRIRAELRKGASSLASGLAYPPLYHGSVENKLFHLKSEINFMTILPAGTGHAPHSKGTLCNTSKM